MERFFKIMVITFLLLIFLGVAFLIYLFNYLEKENIVKLESGESGNVSIEIREEEKGVLKSIVKKIEKFIYREATEHNPEGDLLPDEIDDRIKDKIKNVIE